MDSGAADILLLLQGCYHQFLQFVLQHQTLWFLTITLILCYQLLKRMIYWMSLVNVDETGVHQKEYTEKDQEIHSSSFFRG